MKKTTYYDKHYFDWQQSIGSFGGWANRDKFIRFIKKKDKIIDFGCGGGYLLSHLDCKEKIGIEINEQARKQATALGIRTLSNGKSIPSNWADVIVSNHALEHVFEPLNELKMLYGKLRPGGIIVFVVPCESIRYSYRPENINHHLYSWSPMCLGNLFTQAGFNVSEVSPYMHKWPPFYMTIARIVGKDIFDFLCRMYAHIETSWFQVRIVAYKPKK